MLFPGKLTTFPTYLLRIFMYKEINFPFKFQNFPQNTNIPNKSHNRITLFPAMNILLSTNQIATEKRQVSKMHWKVSPPNLLTFSKRYDFINYDVYNL